MAPKKDDLEALTQNPGESFSALVGGGLWLPK